jgi:hypothetical protein
LPGRKALVWLSNGFLLEPGVVVMEAMTRYLGSDPDLIYSRLKDIGNEGYQSLQWEASRARVTFYSLRAGHDISHAMRSAQEASNPRRISGVAGNPYKMAAKLGEEALRDVAEATGGRAIFTAIYTLGVAVRPDDPIRPRIKVHLRKELKGKIRVTKPLPWRALPPELLTAWLTFPPELSAGFGGSVAVRLHLSRAGLVTEEGRGKSRQCRVALYVQVRGPEGLVLDHTYAILELPVGSVKDDSFTYNLTFRLGPGEYLAEASVSDLIGGGQVSVAEKLTVPVAAAAN